MWEKNFQLDAVDVVTKIVQIFQQHYNYLPTLRCKTSYSEIAQPEKESWDDWRRVLLARPHA